MNNNYMRNGYRKKTGLSGNQQSNRFAGANQKDKQTVRLDRREWDGTLGRGASQINQVRQTGTAGASGTGNTAQLRQHIANNSGDYSRRYAQMTGSRDTGSPGPTEEFTYTGTRDTGTPGPVKNTAQMTGNPAVGTPGPTGAQNAGGYEVSDTVKQAQDQLRQHMANKPGEYSSQYDQQIQQLMDDIQNRGEFSYDMNSDALYKQYAEQFARQGQMAMMDTMGQAAAMTGGYGNSYAQTVGQQAYQGYMQQLNDVMPELYQLAADQYYREGEDLMNQYGMLVAQDEQEYGRYRDEVADYYSELQRLTEDARYQDESAYGKYRDTVGDQQWQDQFAHQKEQDAIGNQQWEDQFAHQKEQDAIGNQQWQDQFAHQKEQDAIGNQQWQAEFDEMASQWEAEYGLSRDQFEEMIRQYDSELGYQRERDAISDEQWQAEFDEMARQWEAEYGLSRDQFEAMINQWESEFGLEQDRFAHQKEQDAIGNEQWQAEFDEMARQWEAEYGLERDQYEQMIRQWEEEMGYQRERDAISDEQWEKQFNEMADQWEAEFGLERDQYEQMIRQWEEEMGYQRERDAAEDAQWRESFDEDKRRYDQEWDRQVLRDQEDDERWAAEFEAAQDRYNASVSSGNSGSEAEPYEMSASEYKTWNEQWGKVTTEAEAEALAERMVAAGVPKELVALWQEEFEDGIKQEEKPEEPVDTNVENEKPYYSPVYGDDKGYKREIWGFD